MYLMWKDDIVMRVDLGYGLFEIFDEQKLPFELRGRITPTFSINNDFFLNRDNLFEFLSQRVLPLSRENAKKILNTLHLTQTQTERERAKVALTTRAVTLQDSFWFKLEEDKIGWDNVNLRKNHLNEIIAQVALHGRSLSLRGKFNTAELSTDGAYAKCWIREDDGPYMLKKSFREHESETEVEVSNLLDILKVPHVKYTATRDNGVYCCKCKCLADDTHSMLAAESFIAYYNRMNKSYLNEALRIDSKSIYTMCIIDYLISNSDRHIRNWGFFYDDSFTILGCHPLFDHNNAFDKDVVKDITGGDSLIFDGKSQLEAAQYSMKRVPFKIPKYDYRKVLTLPGHYKAFMTKVEKLEGFIV